VGEREGVGGITSHSLYQDFLEKKSINPNNTANIFKKIIYTVRCIKIKR
jgi:hypothetical protein